MHIGLWRRNFRCTLSPFLIPLSRRICDDCQRPCAATNQSTINDSCDHTSFVIVVQLKFTVNFKSKQCRGSAAILRLIRRRFIDNRQRRLHSIIESYQTKTILFLAQRSFAASYIWLNLEFELAQRCWGKKRGLTARSPREYVCMTDYRPVNTRTAAGDAENELVNDINVRMVTEEERVETGGSKQLNDWRCVTATGTELRLNVKQLHCLLPSWGSAVAQGSI